MNIRPVLSVYAFVAAMSVLIATAQNIVGNPTASQAINQPSGTTLTLNRVVASAGVINGACVVDGQIYTTIASAYNDTTNCKGTILIPPGYSETLSAPLTLNRSNTVVHFLGSATITQGVNPVVIPAGVQQVSITSDFLVGGNGKPTGSVTGVTFQGYSGSGAAFQIGSTGACTGQCSSGANNVVNVYLKGITVALTSAPMGAIGVQLARVQQFSLDSIGIYGGSASSQVGILLDGTGYFTGIGEINFLNMIFNPNAPSAVGIRAQNATTDTLITGGSMDLFGTQSVCFDANGVSSFAELIFYSPNCDQAGTALTAEGANANAKGDIRIDGNIQSAGTLANFDSHTSGNKIRFINATGGTVVDNGYGNSVEFPPSAQVHSDQWQTVASSLYWGTVHTTTNVIRIWLAANNTFLGGEGTGALMINNGNGTGGVYIYNGGTTVVGRIDSGGNATFNGNLTVQGTKSFRIDDPLDPERKYLYHAAVESPDMKNIYDGVVTLGPRGTAVVRLPAYFEALNKDFRYQLTCIGGAAPVYVAHEIERNRFVIAGGRSGLKVSWQVTGIRHDPYANSHRMVVEREKAGEDSGLPSDLEPPVQKKASAGQY